jgi:parallel beta-helix repeat protein
MHRDPYQATLRSRPAVVALLAAACLLLPPGAARAAESYASCTGFIDALPATIGTPGTWCLRADLSTSLASGVAISLASPDITLDCNGFKVGGLAAGASTAANGIQATDQANVTVRNCNVRGFRIGVSVTGGGGNVVEDNRVERCTRQGIFVGGNNQNALSVVRRNHVLDLGGAPEEAMVEGISTYSTGAPAGGGVLVHDNVVSGFVAEDASLRRGIQVSSNHHASIRDNLVRGDATAAIYVFQSSAVVLRDNRIFGNGSGLGSYGLQCVNVDESLDDPQAKDNIILGFDNGLSCNDAGGNIVEALVVPPSG